MNWLIGLWQVCCLSGQGRLNFYLNCRGIRLSLEVLLSLKQIPSEDFLLALPLFLWDFYFSLGFFYFLSLNTIAFNWQTILLIYASFEIGNTMFSSSKDMEGALGLFITLILIAIPLYFARFKNFFN